MKVVIDVNRKT